MDPFAVPQPPRTTEYPSIAARSDSESHSTGDLSPDTSEFSVRPRPQPKAVPSPKAAPHGLDPLRGHSPTSGAPPRVEHTSGTNP